MLPDDEIETNKPAAGRGEAGRREAKADAPRKYISSRIDHCNLRVHAFIDFAEPISPH